jgi:hypothetical protein
MSRFIYCYAERRYAECRVAIYFASTSNDEGKRFVTSTAVVEQRPVWLDVVDATLRGHAEHPGHFGAGSLDAVRPRRSLRRPAARPSPRPHPQLHPAPVQVCQVSMLKNIFLRR